MRVKTDRLKLAQEIVETICEEDVYASDSGLARNVVDGLWKLPVGVIQQLHTLVVLGARPERHITHALALIEDIGRQVRVMCGDRHGDSKLSRVGVRLYAAGMLVWEADLGHAITCLAGDVYLDETRNWSTADSAEVYVY
jgi:hypothetical protein